MTEIAQPVAIEAKMLSAQTEKKDFDDVAIGEDEEHEVFKTTTDGVQFRTVKWPVASIIFLKREFDLCSLPKCKWTNMR